MRYLVLIVVVVFLLTFLALPRNGAGWFWDIGGAMGYLALAGLLFQMIPRAHAMMLKRHENLGYGVLGIALLHAFWLLIGDGTVRYYLLPGAPLYMWLGLCALLALVLLTVLARFPDRLRVHPRFQDFRLTHRILGAIVVVTAGLHVILSGFYLPEWWQAGVLVGAAAVFTLWRGLWRRPREVPTGTLTAFAVIGVAAIAAFVIVRSLTA